jgi:hypothetical protein
MTTDQDKRYLRAAKWKRNEDSIPSSKLVATET